MGKTSKLDAFQRLERVQERGDGMSKKYVIDLPDDAQYILINGESENHCYTRVEQVDDLEELNSDYINEHFGSLQDEAYQRGINDGSLDVKQRVEGAYQRGLGDAWKLAEDVIYNRGNVLDILHCATVGAAFDKYSAEQAMDILRTYEYKQKEKDRIEVGDEVIAPCGKAVVTLIETDDLVHYLYSGGDYGCIEPQKLKKTGKHYDIQSILEAMRE